MKSFCLYPHNFAIFFRIVRQKHPKPTPAPPCRASHRTATTRTKSNAFCHALVGWGSEWCCCFKMSMLLLNVQPFKVKAAFYGLTSFFELTPCEKFTPFSGLPLFRKTYPFFIFYRKNRLFCKHKWCLYRAMKNEQCHWSEQLDFLVCDSLQIWKSNFL